MAAPTVSDLSAYTGQQLNALQAEAVIAIVTTQAKSYTRGRGWNTNGEPADDLRAVILTASARRLTDPTQTITDRSMGPFSTSYRPIDGWSTAELYTLNRYRERAR